MKKMMMFLAFVGLGLTTQVDVEAHNGYSDKKKTTQRAQARKHAYRSLMHNARTAAVAAHDAAYAPAAQAEVVEADAHAGQRLRAHQHRKISVKQAMLVLLLLSAQHVCLLPGRDEKLSLAQGRIDKMWPGIAERIGLPADFPIAVGEHSRCSFGYSSAKSVYENPWCPNASITINSSVAAQASDDALAWLMGHEATHAKYDCNKLGVVEGALRKTRNEFLYSADCPVLPSEVEIIAEFEMQKDLPRLRSMMKTEVKEFHLKKAGDLGFAISRLKEFRADRIGCEVAVISNCGQSALEALGGPRWEEPCDSTHPSHNHRITALEKKKTTPLLPGGVTLLRELSRSLDITGQYSDEDILAIAEKALEVVTKL